MLLTSWLPSFSARAQSTAFTYQGRLNDGSAPANGVYDLTFALFDQGTNGLQWGATFTNAATPVSNGLFTVSLDFGNSFSGDRWLELGVRTNGGTDFTTLAPRQPITPVPFALTAGTILPGGIPAGTYTNAIVFNNAGNQFFGNGVGVTNLPFGSLSPSAQGQMTNVAAGAAGGVQTNLNALAAVVVDTNLFSLLSFHNLLVAPYTNLPAGLLTNPFYFSPARGPDYIQLAINSLPSYPDRQHVGGGEIAVMGINYFPHPLVLTNSGFNGNIMSYRLYSPTFTGGALVCQTTPCIHVLGFGNGAYGSDTAFSMDNLIVSTLQNNKDRLFDMDVSVTDSEVTHCWFGYWPYLTNQMVVGSHQGVATPNTGEGITKNNLVVRYCPGATDRHVFNFNHLTGVDCLLVDCDHFECQYNFFMECGGNASLGVRSTDWPVATAIPLLDFASESTLLWTGASVVLAQSEPHRNFTFTDNYFYQCAGAYYSPWPQIYFYSHHDAYEGTVFSSLTPAGIQFHMIDSENGVNSYTLGANNTITADGQMRGGLWLDAATFPFNQNGSGLSNLNASSIIGTLRTANLPGITTTVSTGGSTMYITNGLVMRVSTP